MKQIIAIFAFLFTLSQSLTAQTIPDYEKIKLDVKEDYNQAANDAALTAANYLLSNPIEKESLTRLQSAKYLIRWMTGSPDYSFSLDVGKIFKKNDDLLIVYMAAMTKYCMENKSNGKDVDVVKLGSYKILADYCKKGNSVKQTSEVKKLIEAYDAGQLEKYLDIKK